MMRILLDKLAETPTTWVADRFHESERESVNVRNETSDFLNEHSCLWGLL